MKIKEVMTPHAEYVDPATTIRDAAKRMKNMDIGALPVGENDKLVGMVTDRDITTRAVADGKNPQTTPVSEVMTRGIKYCFEDDKIENAAITMEDKQIHRLVVLNNNKRMVGIVSVGDFAVKDNDNNLTGEIVSRISEPVQKLRE
ncbi:MAG TPA: CBS domain-containing protein [Ignavibacteria bacterium]|nr:CBS domain-containing protein [Ignavibacteria bacterium]